MNKEEIGILIDQIDKAIDEILEIKECKGKDSKLIYPIYRLIKLKKGIRESAENEIR